MTQSRRGGVWLQLEFAVHLRAEDLDDITTSGRGCFSLLPLRKLNIISDFFSFLHFLPHIYDFNSLDNFLRGFLFLSLSSSSVLEQFPSQSGNSINSALPDLTGENISWMLHPQQTLMKMIPPLL